MNIFSVLSMGKSNIHEPSMSAMLAYLLNPNQDHGLGRKVINSFLELANNNEIYSGFIDNESLKFDIDLEVPYWCENKRNDIDIQIKVLDGSYNELHRIIIENKIKSGAANSKQLNLYYQAVINDKDNDDAFELSRENLSVVFLTPKLKSNGLYDEFNNLVIDNKAWLYWNSEDLVETTIVKLIQDILKLEQEARISPINEYMRHTLKAFTHYIIKTISISDGKNRVGIDIGDYGGPIVKRCEHKAGMIKLATGNDPISKHQEKIFRSVVNTHLETGVPILTHTNSGKQALEQVEMFDKLGADLGHIVISHMDKCKDVDYNRAVLETGVYVDYDSAFRWKEGEENWTYKLLTNLLADFPDQIVMGMDAAKNVYWRSYGGKPGLDFLLTTFKDDLKKMGLDQYYQQIFFDNPQKLYEFI